MTSPCRAPGDRSGLQRAEALLWLLWQVSWMGGVAGGGGEEELSVQVSWTRGWGGEERAPHPLSCTCLLTGWEEVTHHPETLPGSAKEGRRKSGLSCYPNSLLTPLSSRTKRF